MAESEVGKWNRDAIFAAFETMWSYNDNDDITDLYIHYDVAGIGDFYRAWHALERPWLDGITLAELIALVPLDSFDTESSPDARRYHWSQMLHQIWGEMKVDRLSLLLWALAARQNAFYVDPRVSAGPFTFPQTRTQYGVRVPKVVADFDRHIMILAAQSLHSALFMATSLIEDEAVAESILDLPSGSYTAFQEVFGRDSTLGARKELGETELPSAIQEVVRRVLETRRPVDSLLVDSARRYPENAHVAHALGTHLALTGDHGEAVYYLRKAHEVWPGDVATAYMLVDASAAYGKPPPANVSMGSFLSIPATEDETELEYLRSVGMEEDPYFGYVDDWQRFLILRGLRVELGVECPYSLPSDKWTASASKVRPTSDSNTTDLVTRAHFDKRMDESEMNSASRSAQMERRYSRESWLIEELARVIDAQSYANAERHLADTVKPWSEVVPKAQRQLIAAWYLWHEREVHEIAQAELILFSLRIAVEQQLRKVEGISPKAFATLKELLERLEARTSDHELVAQLTELAWMGNRSGHSPLPPFLADVDRAWALVVGQDGQQGCLQQLLSLGKSRKPSPAD